MDRICKEAERFDVSEPSLSRHRKVPQRLEDGVQKVHLQLQKTTIQ